MKIAMVCSNYSMGGVQRVTSILGIGLAKYHDLYFYSMFSDDNYYEISSGFIDGRTIFDRVLILKKILKAPSVIERAFLGEFKPTFYALPNLNKFITFIKKQNIDMIIMNGHLLTSFIPFLKRKLKDVRFVAWQHNNADIYLKKYATKFISSYKEGLKVADSIVCLTKYDLEIFSKYNPNIFQIYNPITVDENHINDLSALDTKVICFVGRIDIQHKGLDYLLEVSQHLPKDWTIEIAGNGDEKEVRRFHRMIKQYNLSDKVILKGDLKGKELYEHFRRGSIFILTSRWEGFGLVLVEAMSFGLPVVAFSQSGSKEILNDGEYGILCENGNIEEMVKNINILTNNQELMKEYKKKSKDRSADFSMKKIIKKWSEVLDFCMIGNDK